MFGARSSTNWPARRGFSIPMVLLFCSLMVLVLVAFVQTRINMKQQTRLTFRQLKAHYLAQTGIQHALLKLRVLPLESYDAAAISRTICPFVPPGTTPPVAPSDTTAWRDLLDEFISDLDTDDYPISAYSADFPNWNYRAASVRALAAEKQGNDQTHAVEIKMEGELNENYKGVALMTTDEVTRVVKITRQR